MIERLVHLDQRVYRAERLAVALILGLMGFVVFLDVVHRVSTRTGSVLANPAFVAAVASLVAVLGFRTRGSSQAILKGVGVGVAIAVAQYLFVWLVPNGLVWSQPMALGLTLWLGTIGASLAAHERRHLALDIGSKIWPARWVRPIAAAGHVFTALFCVLIAWLAMRSVGHHFDLWRDTDGAAGNLSGASALVFGKRIMIPVWIAALSIPYGMVVIAARFLLEAWRVATGQIEAEVDELAQLGIPTRPNAPDGQSGESL